MVVPGQSLHSTKISIGKPIDLLDVFGGYSNIGSQADQKNDV